MVVVGDEGRGVGQVHRILHFAEREDAGQALGQSDQRSQCVLGCGCVLQQDLDLHAGPVGGEPAQRPHHWRGVPQSGIEGAAVDRQRATGLHDDGRGDGDGFGPVGDGGRAAQHPAHALVLDAGFEKALAFGKEALAGIEPFRLDLGMQGHGRPMTSAGLGQQGQQHGLSDAPAAPGRQHGHAPDPMIRGEPGGADGLPCGVAGDHVVAQRIQRILFEVARNALFLHEHGLADPVEIIPCGHVVDRFDAIVARAHGCASSKPGSSSSRASW